MGLLTTVNKIDALLKNEYDWRSGSCEAINFQANSSFPIELTAIFQSVFDFANEHESVHGVVDTVDKAALKHTAIRKFILEVISKDIISVVKKHTMFEVDSILTNLPIGNQDITSVWMMIKDSTEKYDEVLEAITLAEGNGGHIDASKQTLHEMLDAGKSIDKKRGSILRGTKWKIDINIPVGIFVIKDILTKNVDKCQMTAAEITSVFLHELGHVFSFVEYTVDICYTGYYGNNILRDVTAKFEKKPKVVVAETIALGEKHVNSIENKVHKVLVKNALSILKRADKYIDINETEVDPDVAASYDKSVLEQLFIFLIVLIIVCLNKGLLISYTIGLFFPIRGIIDALNVKYNNSREYKTDKNDSMFERLADEYVSRYKMSKELNNALLKIFALYSELAKLGYSFPIYNKTTRDNMLLQLCVHMIMAPATIMSYLWYLKFDGMSIGYENNYVRLKRNVSNLVDVVKDRNMDINIRNSIVHDIDEMESIIVKNKSTLSLNMFDKVVKLILNTPDIILVDSFRYIFGSAGADKEYKNLLENLDNMLSNKSFYYSAKIAGLFGK